MSNFRPFSATFISYNKHTFFQDRTGQIIDVVVPEVKSLHKGSNTQSIIIAMMTYTKPPVTLYSSGLNEIVRSSK